MAAGPDPKGDKAKEFAKKDFFLVVVPGVTGAAFKAKYSDHYMVVSEVLIKDDDD